jgi:hypothetical protein
VAWVSDWMWTTGAIPLLTFGLLLFPDGHLPSPRWRPVAWLAGATLAMYVFGSAFHSEPLFNHPTIANPVGIVAAAPLLRIVQPVSAVLLAVVVVCSAASILIRFGRALGLQRQQLKWLTYAVTVTTVALLLASREWAGWAIAEVIALLAAGFIPVAIGIAILRYRLFDIDRLISRPWSMGCSRRCWPGCTRPETSSPAACSIPPMADRGWPWPPPPWPWPRCSGRCSAHPEPGRPAFQPISLQRGQDHRGVQRSAA